MNQEGGLSGRSSFLVSIAWSLAVHLGIAKDTVVLALALDYLFDLLSPLKRPGKQKYAVLVCQGALVLERSAGRMSGAVMAREAWYR